jgi:hypothetical protein
MPNSAVTVTVTFIQNGQTQTYTITKAATANGSFTVSHTSAAANATITVTPTPNADYEVESVSYKVGENTEQIESQGGNYKFSMPAGNVTVTVVFTQDTPTPPEVTYGEYIVNVYLERANGEFTEFNATDDQAYFNASGYADRTPSTVKTGTIIVGTASEDPEAKDYSNFLAQADQLTGVMGFARDFENANCVLTGVIEEGQTLIIKLYYKRAA